MSFLPDDFVVPTQLNGSSWHMRPICAGDNERDFEAVMSSRQQLWRRFGERWGWPEASMSPDENQRQLAWHEAEFARRSSFDYAVLAPDESRLLGCVYVDPPADAHARVDAEIWFWVRDSELQSGLEAELGQAVRDWIEQEWPFGRVLWQGEPLALDGKGLMQTAVGEA
jgi:hypothetical protein